MIKSLSHATIYVDNQAEALAFYTEKLGFEVRMDFTMDGPDGTGGAKFRWLTVGPKGQKDLEIVLMEPTPGMMFDQETASMMRQLIHKGAMGAGVFHTDDCKATYEQLKAKGVEFMTPPEEKPYGIEATFRDNSGNWFSLTQPRGM